jgi:hypothetical protein
MATQTEVYNALMQLAKNAAYPDGLNNPSVVGVPVNVITGWPNPTRLQAAQAGEAVTVSIYKVPNLEKPTISFQSNWQTLTIVEPTLFMTVVGDTVTITGTISLPQNCLIRVNGTPYHYKVVANDTPNSIAANMAALIPNAAVNNNIITITGAYRLQAIVGVTGIAIKEVNRQEANFYITVWAATDELREAVAQVILVAIGNTKRIDLPDGETARLKYHTRRDEDKSQKVGVYRTDLIVAIEYAITQKATFYTITDTQLNITYVPSIS